MEFLSKYRHILILAAIHCIIPLSMNAITSRPHSSDIIPLPLLAISIFYTMYLFKKEKRSPIVPFIPLISAVILSAECILTELSVYDPAGSFPFETVVYGQAYCLGLGIIAAAVFGIVYVRKKNGAL